MTTSSEFFTGMSSYTSFASHAYSGSVGAYGVALGASHTSSTYQNNFNKDFNFMTTTWMACTLYMTELSEYDPPNFSVSFRNGVFSLPEVYEEGPYMAFFNEFGTHYINKAWFGSAYYYNQVWE